MSQFYHRAVGPTRVTISPRRAVLTQQDLGRDVGSVRENFEAGRTLSMLASYAADGMVAKLGSGGLVSPEDAITCWRKLFHAPGGVDFAEMGRAAAPLAREGDGHADAGHEHELGKDEVSNRPACGNIGLVAPGLVSLFGAVGGGSLLRYLQAIPAAVVEEGVVAAAG